MQRSAVRLFGLKNRRRQMELLMLAADLLGFGAAVGARVLGAVFNEMDPRSRKYGYYYNRYYSKYAYYHSDDGEKKKKKV